MGDATETQDTEPSENKNRLERFLPNVSVRVLLVEADDSTRQIIAALLRKCSYKVAAVSDGLKALEVIRERAHSIDLILTEVELPSISGYALLALIMEHDACKNIPVIMMSSEDSVSMVYKCMLRGATDFLVKPLRINELRNLWQHVWRKQASSASGPGPLKESLAHEKIEATAENNAVSNHSSGYMACGLERNWECIERGSDAQSSCTKPGLETKGADMKHTHSLSQLQAINRPPDFINSLMQEGCNQETKKTRAYDNNLDDNNNNNDDDDDVPENLAREAIDLIGTFDNNYQKGTRGGLSLDDYVNKLDCLPPLDLSLRRSHPSCSVNQVNDETSRLNHSDASAFSRYRNKTLQPQNSLPSTCNQQKDHKTNSEKQIFTYTPEYNSDRISSQKHILTPSSSIALEAEICQPIPVKGVRIENVINGFVSMMPQTMYPSQSGPSPFPGPSTINNLQFPPHSHPSQQFYDSSTTDRVDSQKMKNLEDESGNSRLYTVSLDTNSISVVDEEGFIGANHGSMQRVAALNKFRQKRKDRCFKKKVRYESRKKLAEQRPRVKGQFVRQ